MKTLYELLKRAWYGTLSAVGLSRFVPLGAGGPGPRPPPKPK